MRSAGGLNLSDLPPIMEEEEERVAPSPYDSLFDEAVQELGKRGVKLDLTEPGKDLAPLPEDPVSLGHALFAYYDETLQHWRFLSSVAAEIEARIVVLENSRKHLVASLQKSHGLKTKEDPQILLDKEFIECNTQIVRLQTQLSLLEPKKSYLHRRMQLLSRLVEGVKQDWDGESRRENFNRRPRRGTTGDLPTE